MKRKMRVLGIIAAAVVIGFSMTGCVTADSPSLSGRLPGVSDYTVLPSKDYVVVGTVVLRNVNSQTLTADLIDAAIAMGGHDIMNLRVDWSTNLRGERQITTASAVVIRYTDETLIDETTVTIMVDGIPQTITSERRHVVRQ